MPSIVVYQSSLQCCTTSSSSSSISIIIVLLCRCHWHSVDDSQHATQNAQNCCVHRTGFTAVVRLVVTNCDRIFCRQKHNCLPTLTEVNKSEKRYVLTVRTVQTKFDIRPPRLRHSNRTALKCRRGSCTVLHLAGHVITIITQCTDCTAAAVAGQHSTATAIQTTSLTQKRRLQV